MDVGNTIYILCPDIVCDHVTFQNLIIGRHILIHIIKAVMRKIMFTIKVWNGQTWAKHDTATLNNETLAVLNIKTERHTLQ